MAGCVSYTDRDYRDYLAAKNDNIREEIAADSWRGTWSDSWSDARKQKAIDEDFAKRNADLKDYIQPNITAATSDQTFAGVPQIPLLSAFQNVPALGQHPLKAIDDSDGFYGVVPKTNAGLLAVLDIYKRLVRDLTDVVINQAGK